MKKKNSIRRSWILGAVILVLAYWGYSSARYQYFIRTAVNSGNPIDTPFLIKKGESVSTIAKNLQDKDLILDADAFRNYTKDSGDDRKIIPGRFMLNQALTIPEISSKLTNHKEGELSLTVPEGTTIRGIDQRLTDIGIINAGEFIQATKDFNDYKKYPFLDEQKIRALPHPLEGYLFPDTYFIDAGHFNNQDVIDLMLKNFGRKLPADAAASAKKNGHTLYDVITMASMVEKEVKTDADRAKVAGVLWKRNDEHWFIGADATLLYLKDDRTIDSKDLTENSPYNTRNRQGLPPGPIDNPGLESIEAALTPETTTYYYYLTKPGTGEVVYARTNDEHNANKARYL